MKFDEATFAIKRELCVNANTAITTCDHVELAIKLIAADAQRVQAEAISKLVDALTKYVDGYQHTHDGSVRHTNINIG